MKDFLKADKFSLDDECAIQAQLYDEWSEKLADAEAERDDCKLELEFYEADLDKVIRNEFPDYTETAIKFEIRRDENYRVLLRKYNESRKTVKKMEGVVHSLQQKRSSLSDLVKLYLNNYYSTPSVTKDNKDGLEDKNRDDILEGLNKNERLLRRR